MLRSATYSLGLASSLALVLRPGLVGATVATGFGSTQHCSLQSSVGSAAGAVEPPSVPKNHVSGQLYMLTLWVAQRCLQQVFTASLGKPWGFIVTAGVHCGADPGRHRKCCLARLLATLESWPGPSSPVSDCIHPASASYTQDIVLACTCLSQVEVG